MAELMEAITSLAKRRGIVFPSSEIYGGLRSSWDYGPLGVELKRNVRERLVALGCPAPDDVVGLDAAIIMSPKVWEASGHLDVFTDPLVECLQLPPALPRRPPRRAPRPQSGHEEDRTTIDMHGKPTCPNCGNDAFTEPRNFNLMFKTHMGPVEDEANAVYLRPETAQGMFVDFVTVQAASRKKLPFGIAQIGKSFRNEITPGNFIFRMREFEQMEIEFFVEPGTDETWHEYWIDERLRWYTDLGHARGAPARARARRRRAVALLEAHGRHRVPVPVHGVGRARGDREPNGLRPEAAREALGRRTSRTSTRTRNERYHPYVIEPAAGVDRALLAFLIDAYREEEAPTAKGGTEKRTFLALHRDLAPTKVAVLPLSRNEQLTPGGPRPCSIS